jgi:hypothetical protein
MTDKTNPSDPVKPSGRGSRRPRTIDLEATEVTPKSTAAQSGSDASGEPPYTEASEGRTQWLPPGGARPMFAGVAFGAVVMFIVMVVLWTAGYVGGAGNDGAASRTVAADTQPRERPAPQRNSDAKALEELTARIDILEKSVASPPPPLNDPALANRLASAENATRTFADDIGGLNRRVDDLTSAVRDLRTRVEAMTPVDKSEFEALANRIAALEKSAGTLESEIGKRATITSDRAVRLALATSALRAAVERGEPFTSELAAARPLAPEDSFASLEPFANSGVPSNAALARELAALVPALRNAANATPPDSGFFERLKFSASRLVRIRPAEDSASDDPMAVINRIDTKAATADVAGALAELARLPPAVRAPAQAWIGKAEARIKAIAASRQLAADAIGALGKAAP